MSRNTQIVSAFFLSAGLVMGTITRAPAQDRVRAKIGIQIQSGDRVRWAKAKDRINVEDKIRIYVVPKEDTHFYVVHSDNKTASQLVNDKSFREDSIITLPSKNEFYQFDGVGKVESITIICSPVRLVNVWDVLKSTNVPHAKWADIERELIEASAIDLGERAGKPEKRILIGGLVRNLPNQTNTEGDDVSYQIALNEPCDEPLTFNTTNLPPGLSIDPASGIVRGTITSQAAAGSPYSVTVTVPDDRGRDCFSDTFKWTVIDNPAFTKELQELRTFSGKSLLVKKYEFTIKK
jgi:hypothetical protein